MSEHKVSWGKILTGAAIAAGAVAVFVVYPEVGMAIMHGIRDAAAAVYHGIGSAGKWVFDSVIGGADPKLVSAASTQTAAVNSLEHVKDAAEAMLKNAPTDAAKEAAGTFLGEIGKTLGTLKDTLGDAVAKAAKSAHGLLGFAIQNKAIAIGTAAAAGGLAASSMHAQHHAHAHHAQTQNLEDESFAMREDMRRMQALMAARMAATGYKPAMAMANQPIRG